MKSFFVPMVTLQEVEALVLTSTGTDKIGLFRVIFMGMICPMFRVVLKIVVENVLKHQDALILHGRIIWEVLAG